MCCFTSANAQGVDQARPVLVAAAELPDAPQPQATNDDLATALMSDSQSAQQPATSSSTTQAPQPDSTPAKSGKELAEEQLKQQKKQRILGVLPNFNTSYNSNAVSLTAGQKFRLAFASATDPVQFGVAGFVSLISQAEGSPEEYGGGMEGYAKRYGSSYADAFDGAIIGNALLPSILHQDPRYFRLGYGKKMHRILYALATNVICKHDNTGKWEPNYSNVLGNIASGGISNLYAPESERGVGNTFESAFLVTAEGGVGSLLQEFWPDVSRKFFHKDPTHGQDAINNALRK